MVAWSVKGDSPSDRHRGLQAIYTELRGGRPEAAVRHSAAYWRSIRIRVTEPLAAALAEEAAAEEADAERQARLAADVAEALATRACAHAGCSSIVGASEAAVARGKRCGKCEVARFCGRGCQVAAWPAHKAGCRELVRRREEAAAA